MAEEAVVKVGKHFSLIIPEEIRSLLPLKEGDQVKITDHKTYLKIEVIDPDPFTKVGEILGNTDFRDENLSKKAEERFFENK